MGLLIESISDLMRGLKEIIYGKCCTNIGIIRMSTEIVCLGMFAGQSEASVLMKEDSELLAGQKK